MFIYKDGEQYNVPTKWLEKHDAEVRAKVIDEFVGILKENFINAEDLNLSSCFFEYIDRNAEQLKDCNIDKTNAFVATLDGRILQSYKCKDCSHLTEFGYCMLKQDYKSNNNWCPMLTITTERTI